MKTELFDYDLPRNLIAQYPVSRRGTSRLLVLDRKTGDIEHRRYSDILEYLDSGDVVVLNKTKVLKARIFPTVERTGARIELLLLKNLGDDNWECLIGGARKVRVRDRLIAGEFVMTIKLRDNSSAIFTIHCPNTEKMLMMYGHVPLPPYIRREDKRSDILRYNTVFAEREGSVAAPTASLNLTRRMIARMRIEGVTVASVNLAISWGTFAPVVTKNIEDFDLHREYVEVPQSTADIINNCTGKVVAFGTTVCRALETSVVAGKSTQFEGETDLFIYPGFEFKVVSSLVTNFHAPKSSLLMLVSAFAGRENILKAYECAQRDGYKFLSYGDSMLIK